MVAKRPHVVAVRLTNEEREDLDRLRGPLTQTQFLRRLLLDARKRRSGDGVH